jgi:hypothetical protein
MANNPRKRQKKLERRSARRKEKKQTVARQESGGLPARLAAASQYPILHCWVMTALEDSGMGSVLLSRQSGGMVAVAVFLVDRYCLGVKDAFGEVLHRADYDRRYVPRFQTEHPSRDIAPADARKLLEDAVAYARSIGLHPHADYVKVLPLFGDIDPAQGAATFDFGDRGKPHFIAGPYDSPERIRQILAILEHQCGPDGYYHTIPFGEEDFFEDDDELTWDEEDRRP